MKVILIGKEGNKKIIKFKNGMEIIIPDRHEIEVGMNLKLQYEGIIPIEDYIGEFALVFTLSNEDINFNLYVNEIFCDEEDDMNLYSTFTTYGKVNMLKVCYKSPIYDLVKSLKYDGGYYNGWQAHIALAFQDAYINAEDKTDIYKISNIASTNFLNLLMGKNSGR
jgi:hypothetical protein